MNTAPDLHRAFAHPTAAIQRLQFICVAAVPIYREWQQLITLRLFTGWT
jgi:hypothetical protein